MDHLTGFLQLKNQLYTFDAQACMIPSSANQTDDKRKSNHLKRDLFQAPSVYFIIC